MRSVVAFLALAASQSAGGQHLRGRVLDRESNRPIAAAVLTLYAADSTVVALAVSDADGRWRFDAPPPPPPTPYFIAIRRLGYRPWVSQAMGVDVGSNMESVFSLQPLPLALDPISARAEAIRRSLDYSGFFERQRSNFGHFLTPEAIERRQAARITDLLTTIPGVQLVVSGTVGPAQIGLRASGLTSGTLCRPRVFVDGLMYARGDSRPVRVRPTDATERAELEEGMDRALSLDDIGHPSTIAAIEVYRSAVQVPVQFGGTSVETLCGVIVIWTQSGRLERPQEDHEVFLSQPGQPRESVAGSARFAAVRENRLAQIHRAPVMEIEAAMLKAHQRRCAQLLRRRIMRADVRQSRAQIVEQKIGVEAYRLAAEGRDGVGARAHGRGVATGAPQLLELSLAAHHRVGVCAVARWRLARSGEESGKIRQEADGHRVNFGFRRRIDRGRNWLPVDEVALVGTSGQSHFQAQCAAREVLDRGDVSLAAKTGESPVRSTCRATGNAVAVSVVGIGSGDDGLVGNRLDQPETKERRRKEPTRVRSARRDRLASHAVRHESRRHTGANVLASLAPERIARAGTAQARHLHDALETGRTSGRRNGMARAALILVEGRTQTFFGRVDPVEERQPGEESSRVRSCEAGKRRPRLATHGVVVRDTGHYPSREDRREQGSHLRR